MWARVIATMSNRSSAMAWRAVAMSGMRAAWKTGSPTSRRKAPTLARNGASGCDMPGMLCSARTKSVSMRPKMALKKSICALALEQLGEPHAFLEADALLDVLVDHEADADDVVVADPLADGLVHHQAEARAVLQRAAEGVGAAVGARRQELADQMAAGHGLAAVEPALLAAPGGGGVVGDDAVDVVPVHLAREVAMAAFADRGRRHGRQPVHRRRGGAPAEMRDLAHDRGAVAVDAPREGLQVGDDGVAPTCRSGRRPSSNRAPPSEEPPNMVRAMPPLAFSSW